MGVNEKGFSMQGPGKGVRSVTPQGASGAGLGGPAVPNASMPISGGKVPHQMPMGPSMDQCCAPQNGVMPKVGK